MRASVVLCLWAGRLPAEPVLLVLDRGSHELVLYPDLDDPCDGEYLRFGFGAGPASSAFPLPRGPNRSPALLVNAGEGTRWQVLYYELEGSGSAYVEARPLGDGAVVEVGEAPPGDDDRFLVMSRGMEPGLQVAHHRPGSATEFFDLGPEPRILRMARGSADSWQALEFDVSTRELRLGDTPPAARELVATLDRRLEDMKLVDINRDGLLDLVLLASGEFAVAIQFPGRLFSPLVWRSYPGEGRLFSFRDHRIIVGDFDGDFRNDILIAVDAGQATEQYIQALYLGDGTGDFPRVRTMFLSHLGARIAAGDVDEDGEPDLVQVEDDGYLWSYRGKGDGSFEAWDGLRLPVRDVGSADLYDLDTDGHLDLLLTGDGDVHVLTGDGQGGFEPGERLRVGGTPVDLVEGLFDENGAPEIAVLFSGPSRIEILSWDRERKRFRAPRYLDAIQGLSLHAVDSDGDGHLDLVVGGTDGTIQALPGRGDGTFAPPATRKYGVELWRLADLDLDGRPEMLGMDASSGRIAVYGNRDGLFFESTLLAGGREPSQLAVIDFDDDGSPDLAVANKLDSTVSLFRNEGELAFSAAGRPLPCGGGPILIESGDLNGDGRDDLATLNEWTGDVSILLRDPDGLFLPEFRGGSRASDMLFTDVPMLFAAGGPSLLLLTDLEVEVFRDFAREKSGCGYFGVPGNGPGRVLVADFTRNDEVDFVRGDANRDAEVDASDAVAILYWLFLGEPSSCLDVLDVDDSGKIQLADVIRLLRYVFVGGEGPAAPFPQAGSDPSGDALGRCLAATQNAAR